MNTLQNQGLGRGGMYEYKGSDGNKNLAVGIDRNEN